MANSNFVVKNGLTVGNLSIDATDGSITTTGNITVNNPGTITLSGGLAVSSINKNDTSITINDTGSGSSIVMAIDNTTEHTVDSDGVNLASGDRYAIAGTSVLNANTLGSGVVNSSLTSVGTLTTLSVDNISINDNTISSSNSNGNIILDPNGTGFVIATVSTMLSSPAGEAATFKTSAALTDAMAVFAGNVNSFAQFSLVNTASGTSASTDLIVYADNGTNSSGWIDMGITSSGFSTPLYGITEAGDGYIFMSAPASATVGGNLVICTDSTGTTNDIVFATNGFTAATEQGRFMSGDGFRVQGNLMSINGSVYQGPNSKNKILDVTASTTLNGGINNSVTTITVVSTTGFDSKGTITIGSEDIFYTGKTSTQFTGCTRGYNSTSAASHLTGAAVTATPYVGLTDATAVFTGNVNAFTQLAVFNENSGSSASTDILCYASDGDNDSGWIDMGITSQNYSDPSFTVTGPGTGYIFMSAPVTTSGTGDFLLGTDLTGSQNDIVFFTNGFDAGNERMRIVGESRIGAPAGVEIYISTASTSTSTGALRVQGGMGLQGNLYVGGNVNIAGNITLGGSGDTVNTQNLTVTNPIIFMGDGNAGNSLDLGFAGEYNISSNELYTGLVKDASDGLWKLFSNVDPTPTTTVNFTGASYDTLYLGNIQAVGSVASTNTTSGTIKVTGGMGVSGNIYLGGNVVATGNVSASQGVFSGGVDSTSTSTGTVRVTGGVGVTGNVVAGGTFQGTATSAQYADLAENYLADAAYEPGTVLEFGGSAEVTLAEDETRRVAGVVSTAPAHLMNSHLQGENVVALALVGRVPCKVRGQIRKGDLLVSGGGGFARPTTEPKVGTIIGKALENFNGVEGVIEVVVGRL
jgi:hypothetical protein